MQVDTSNESVPDPVPESNLILPEKATKTKGTRKPKKEKAPKDQSASLIVDKSNESDKPAEKPKKEKKEKVKKETKPKAPRVTKPKPVVSMIPKLFSHGNLAQYLIQTYVETQAEKVEGNDGIRKKITEIDMGIQQLIYQRKMYEDRLKDGK